jgi:Winged helix DNA-binding domain
MLHDHLLMPTRPVSTAVTRERLQRQLLTRPSTNGPREITRHIFSVQAQDVRDARLALRARSRNPSAADIDRELSDKRTLVVTWLNRGTLHLIDRDDYPLLQLLTTPQLATGNATRLRQEGAAPDVADRAVNIIVKALEN